ncbi:MAG: phosphate ABC transporter permease subunit PstC [Eubacterium sp.]
MKRKEKVFEIIFLLVACISIVAVAMICIFLFANGIPAMGKIGLGKFLGGQVWKPGNDKYGIFPMIIGSLYITGGAIVVGVPIGIFTAVFLAKYCPEGLYKIMKPATELLAGIPSVVYGFFGLMVIVPAVRMIFGTDNTDGMSILTASFLLGIMILPTIIGVTETSIRSVNNAYFEGALALGATKEASIFRCVIPAAKSGILAGVVLGIGRAIGETMAVVMIAGNQPRMPQGILQGVRTLTTNVVLEMGYATGLHREALIATGVVLFVFILIINLAFSIIKGKGVERSTDSDKRKIYVPALSPDFAKILVILAAVFTLVMLGYLIVYILAKGIPHLTPSLFSIHYDSDNVSMLPSIINTLIMIGVALLIAVPVGVFSAVYLTEYAKKGNKLVKVIRTTAETLTGIPSIVYGLFGMLFFVTACHMSYSLMAGILTVAIMVLPTVLRTTEEALLAVPDSFREGSFGLGAGKLRTVFRIVLPSAIPGILSGVILSTGRIAGETAALIYTAGTMATLPKNLLSSGRTLAVHMYVLSQEGLHTDQAFATAVILLVMVLLINILSSVIAKKMQRD